MADKLAHRHGDDCTCTRCAGFQSGNALSRKHGAYATLALGPRVEELAEQILHLVPAYSPADDVAIQLLALCLARIERATEAAENASLEELARLRVDERGWANTARRLLNDLGMTPTSRAKLGLDIARGRGEALRAHLAEKYRPAGADVES